MMVIYILSSIICFIHAGWMIENCDGFGFGIFPVINTFMAVCFTLLLLLDIVDKQDKKQ